MNYLLRKRFLIVTVITVTMLSQITYALPSSSKEDDVMAMPFETNEIEETNLVTQEPKITTGVVATGILNVREVYGTDQKLVGKLTANSEVIINKSKEDWHNITSGDVTGWVSGEFIGDIDTISEKEYFALLEEERIATEVAANKSRIETVINLAKQQLGKPYRYGTKGPGSFDCSGLVGYAYEAIGISVPRSSRSFHSFGTTVSKADLQPGDIILFDTSGAIDGIASHVGLYIGDRQIIHAAVGGRGVVYDSIDAPYYSQRYIKAVRVL